MTGYRTFVVAHDFSENAQAALLVALELAQCADATIHLVHVVEPPVFAYGAWGAAPPPLDAAGFRERAARALQNVADAIESPRAEIKTHVLQDRTPEVIQGFAASLEADLIVMGTHGRKGFARAFLGSVAECTLRGAPCPVLVVPEREARTEEEEGVDDV